MKVGKIQQPCPNCEEEIDLEFEGFEKGQTVVCPHCKNKVRLAVSDSETDIAQRTMKGIPHND